MDIIRKYLSGRDIEAYSQYVQKEGRIAPATPPFFILADIDGFTGFCDNNRSERIISLLESFFGLAANRIHLYHGEVLKFIGDAVFAAVPDKETAVVASNNLLRQYRLNIQTKFGTDLIVLVSQPDHVFKGFVGSVPYVDYSYWSSGINRMFNSQKGLRPGRVYIISKDGVAPV
jgi:hypothetical protein